MGDMIIRYVTKIFFHVSNNNKTIFWQYEIREEPDCRGRLHSAEDGSYAFRAVV